MKSIWEVFVLCTIVTIQRHLVVFKVFGSESLNLAQLFCHNLLWFFSVSLQGVNNKQRCHPQHAGSTALQVQPST